MTTVSKSAAEIETEIAQLQRAQQGERSTSDPSWRARQQRIAELRSEQHSMSTHDERESERA